MWDKLSLRHAGQTGVIIGNGPSLNNVTDGFLDKYPTFGTNRIYLRYTPTYYVCVNPLVFNQARGDILRVESEWKFLPEYFGVIGPGIIPFEQTGDVDFGNPYSGFYQGWTVTYVCLQIALWMSFDTILLVGVDHRYDVPDSARGGTEIISQGDDPNHFSPDYFPEGWAWHAPDLKKSEEAYRMALMEYTRRGQRIVNLTPDTALNVFPRDDMENW